MLESSRREQRAGREEKAPTAGGAAGGDPPPGPPGQRPRQRQTQPGPDPLGAPPAARSGLCTARAKKSASQCSQLLPATPRSRQVPSGTPRTPQTAQERSAPRFGEHSPGGSDRAAPLGRALPRPRSPGVPLQPPRRRGICGPGGPAAPLSLSQDPAADKCPRSAHLSSPHLTPAPGPPGPREPRRSPGAPAPSSRRAPRPERSPGNAYRSS